ncbi:MAG: aspartate/glutamate racemase family protein [Bryobacteraceae bacterium]
MVKRSVSLLHTAPAAIPPILQYWGGAAPEFELTNQLDDGILRFFAAGDYASAEGRLTSMIEAARRVYHAEAAMITCSSVPRSMVRSLQVTAGIPLMKIDEPMAQRAISSGRRIGVAATFPPTIPTTSQMLRETAADAGVSIELVPHLVAGAFDALLNGRPAEHDALLLAGLDELASQRVDVIVLAQVSMSRILPVLGGRITVPVLSSLETSLAAMRELLSR